MRHIASTAISIQQNVQRIATHVNDLALVVAQCLEHSDAVDSLLGYLPEESEVIGVVF